MKQRLSFLLLLGLVPTLALALTVSVSVQNQVCSTPGSCYAEVSGGVPPYTYAWSNGPITQGINGLGAGVYSVTVTDAVSTQATANGTVIVVDHTDQWSLSGDAYCPGDGMPYPFSRWSPDVALGYTGPAPYYFNGVEVPLDPYEGQDLYNVPIESSPGVFAMPGETVQMQFMDGNGCGGTFWATAGYPVVWPTVQILQTEGACAGASAGSVVVAYGAEGHGYSVAAEIRDQSGNIVFQGGYDWYGYAPTTITYTGLPSGYYLLIQRLTLAETSNYYEWCSDVMQFNIPDLGPDCGAVSGGVYMDYNEDCVEVGGETRVPGAVIEFLPGPHYATANGSGSYSINLPNGAYTMQQIDADVAQHCPAPPAPVNVSSNEQTINVGDTALVPLDAQVMLANGPARPGFQLQYAIQVSNLTPASTGGTTTTFTFDPAVTYVSASPAPSSVSGNVVTWNQSALGAFQQRTIHVQLQVPPNVGLIGTVLNASVTCTTANTDVVLANNSAGNAVTVTASFDPNDKTARTSSGYSNELYYIDVDNWVDYTIRFQNTGTDTAFNIIVTDTLPSTLDPSSIEWGASSHACTRSLVGQGVVKFLFANILLPDSNMHEPASHGFVSFRVRPRLPLLPGTVIENTANILFDFNDPVITEPSVLTAEFSTGVGGRSVDGLRLFPNPASHHLHLSDPMHAANIRSWTIIGADGRIVREGRASFPAEGLGIADLRPGSYVVRLVTDAGNMNEHFIKIDRP